MSKSESNTVRSANISINVGGHWFSKHVDSAVLAYACACSYLDSGVEFPGRYEVDRISLKDDIMRACIMIFDGHLKEYAHNGVVIVAEEAQV